MLFLVKVEVKICISFAPCSAGILDKVLGVSSIVYQHSKSYQLRVITAQK